MVVELLVVDLEFVVCRKHYWFRLLLSRRIRSMNVINVESRGRFHPGVPFEITGLLLYYHWRSSGFPFVFGVPVMMMTFMAMLISLVVRTT